MSHRFHLLRLPDLSLECILIGNVLEDGEDVWSGGEDERLKPKKTAPSFAVLCDEFAFLSAQRFLSAKTRRCGAAEFFRRLEARVPEGLPYDLIGRPLNGIEHRGI